MTTGKLGTRNNTSIKHENVLNIIFGGYNFYLNVFFGLYLLNISPTRTYQEENQLMQLCFVTKN